MTDEERAAEQAETRLTDHAAASAGGSRKPEPNLLRPEEKVRVVHVGAECVACVGSGRAPFLASGSYGTEETVVCSACAGKGYVRRSILLADFAKLVLGIAGDLTAKEFANATEANAEALAASLATKPTP